MHNPSRNPSIRKVYKIHGRQLVFRNASVDDAEFILSLRTDAEKSRHLSAVSGLLQDQIDWLDRYASATDQAYFIIETPDGTRQGTVRLYDARGDSFCWGSWILRNGAPSGSAVESTLMVYHYALEVLGFSAAHFDVRRANEGVWSFHERFGAVRVRTTELDYDYTLSNEAIRASLQRYARFLPDPIRVEQLPVEVA